MRKILLAIPVLSLPLALAGCPGFTAATAAIQGAEQQVGPAVMGLDNAIFSVAVAKYQAAQMFKAQIDGTIVLPPLPPPPVVAPAPVPAPAPTPAPVPPPVTPTGPSGPVVTPSLR